MLVLDEVLAVGDERFQRKCLDRIDTLKSSVRPSSSPRTTPTKFRRCAMKCSCWKEGRVVMQGDAQTAVSCYHDLMRQRNEFAWPKWARMRRPRASPSHRENRQGTEEVQLTSLAVYDNHGRRTETSLGNSDNRRGGFFYNRASEGHGIHPRNFQRYAHKVLGGHHRLDA